MAYTPLDVTSPNNTTQNISEAFASIRGNDEALLDLLITVGLVPGWNYSWSGGTIDAPTTITWQKSTDANIRVRATMTYSSNLVQTMKFEKTINAGSLWSKMTYDGKDLVTFTYSGSNVNSYAWSVSP